ncbi:MAG: hypothetical protein KIT11_11515 [Fimbriimonadaceae bacterium]|nr:hypothetical protein [Fimbriimonadaceae bacterium]QYK55339.1 MAG: hypothetical protein KF733_10020 [Fimbriimonadaceae bacterium]
MLSSEAKTFVGSYVNLTYRDRAGREAVHLAEVYDVSFVPHFGPCLITDLGEFRLDRVVGCSVADKSKAA